jgi:low affinity Fe/Cu permease
MAKRAVAHHGATPARAAPRLRGVEHTLSRTFSDIAQITSREVGRPFVFALASATVLVWAITGPLFHFSDTWQLVINTGTTIVTFLMVFLIQNTQNRDTQAIQLKLDELIRSTKGAHNLLIDLEELDDEQLEQLRQTYERLGKIAREKTKSN